VKSPVRKLLTYAITAVYGGLSLLGQGLHLLSEEHGPHFGGNVVECESHHGSHDAAACILNLAGPLEAEQSGVPQLRANGCVTYSHACEVCEFLAQARSLPPQLAAAIERPHVAIIAPCVPPSFSALINLGPHAPRGPPIA
jgi:hypothetical protein